jgi:hypothetical protein
VFRPKKVRLLAVPWGGDAQAALESRSLSHRHQIALVIVRAIDSEQLNLAAIISADGSTLSAPRIDTASGERNDAIPQPARFALDAQDRALVVDGQIVAEMIADRQEHLFTPPRQRGNDLQAAEFTNVTGISHGGFSLETRYPLTL